MHTPICHSLLVDGLSLTTKAVIGQCLSAQEERRMVAAEALTATRRCWGGEAGLLPFVRTVMTSLAAPGPTGTTHTVVESEMIS